MRMWMVDPRVMCRQHLLGEHVEIHMFVGAINKGTSMDGYLSTNMLEPSALARRHDELVAEMLRRGYRHQSDLADYHIPADWLGITIDRKAAAAELFRRCAICRAGTAHEDDS